MGNWATILIIAGVLVAVIGSLILYDALRRPGDERSPEQPHNPRTRADYEAEVAAPVAEADEKAAAPLVAFVEKISTDEFPTLAFEVDPLTAPIPDGHLVEAETFFNDLAAAKLSAFTWTAAVRETVALSSVKVVEPTPYERLEFTQDIWKAVDVQRIIAAARAEAVAR